MRGEETDRKRNKASFSIRIAYLEYSIVLGLFSLSPFDVTDTFAIKRMSLLVVLGFGNCPLVLMN